VCPSRVPPWFSHPGRCHPRPSRALPGDTKRAGPPCCSPCPLSSPCPLHTVGRATFVPSGPAEGARRSQAFTGMDFGITNDVHAALLSASPLSAFPLPARPPACLLVCLQACIPACLPACLPTCPSANGLPALLTARHLLLDAAGQAVQQWQQGDGGAGPRYAPGATIGQPRGVTRRGIRSAGIYKEHPRRWAPVFTRCLSGVCPVNARCACWPTFHRVAEMQLAVTGW